MKFLITLFACVLCAYFSVTAQTQSDQSNVKVVVKKESLQKMTPQRTSHDLQVETEKKEDNATTEAKHTRPVIEMTDEYIDHQIAEIQKVIDKNTANPDFNLSGYQKRIKYLESRRPSK